MSTDTLAPQLPDVIASAENLPSPPSVAMEVLRLTGDEDRFDRRPRGRHLA